jgi:hypothetical protein
MLLSLPIPDPNHGRPTPPSFRTLLGCARPDPPTNSTHSKPHSPAYRRSTSTTASNPLHGYAAASRQRSTWNFRHRDRPSSLRVFWKVENHPLSNTDAAWATFRDTPLLASPPAEKVRRNRETYQSSLRQTLRRNDLHSETRHGPARAKPHAIAAHPGKWGDFPTLHDARNGPDRCTLDTRPDEKRAFACRSSRSLPS